VKLLSVEQILDRLEDQLGLLAHGSRDLPARQQTLRGAIAWSYDLLEPSARQLLQRLSVFVGGWELETAEAVCRPDELGLDILEGLGGLVDQSLVRMADDADPPRFSMLDTIRAFAWEMLADGSGLPEARARHARVFLELAERAAPELSGADQREWLDRLERDHDNIRAALDWAIACPDPELGARLGFAIWRFWQQRGYLNEARDRLLALEGFGEKLPPVLRARLAEACGGVAYWQADNVTARRWYDVALGIWRELGDQTEIANALYNRAYATLVRIMEGLLPDGSEAEAEAMLQEALDLYRQLGNVEGEGNILWGLGTFNYFLRQPLEAVPWYRQALERHRSAGNRTMEAWSQHMLALALIRAKETVEARELARTALELFRDAGDVSGITLVLDDLSLLAVVDGDHQRAGRLWGAARQLERTTGATLASFVQSPFIANEYDAANKVLTTDELERFGAEGAAMSLDDMVAYALSSLEDRSTAVP
jgi:tetratricopeptide (TPR) repeat protein